MDIKRCGDLTLPYRKSSIRRYFKRLLFHICKYTCVSLPPFNSLLPTGISVARFAGRSWVPGHSQMVQPRLLDPAVNKGRKEHLSHFSHLIQLLSRLLPGRQVAADNADWFSKLKAKPATRLIKIILICLACLLITIPHDNLTGPG